MGIPGLQKHRLGIIVFTQDRGLCGPRPFSLCCLRMTKNCKFLLLQNGNVSLTMGSKDGPEKPSSGTDSTCMLGANETGEKDRRGSQRATTDRRLTDNDLAN